MNPTLENLFSHRSVRRFQNKIVAEDQLQLILEAASRASTSGNMQAYSIIVTSDQKIKERLLPLHFNQEMVVEAPLFLTFCADFSRMRQWLELNQAPQNFDNFMSFMIASIDAILAAQNAAIAAESLGLGICYLGTTLASSHAIASELNCPSHVLPVVGFALGHPAERPEVRDRLPLEALIHRETYRPYSNRDIDDIYKERERIATARLLAQEQSKERWEYFECENLAQFYTKAKYTRESHLTYSNDLLKALQERGFWSFN
jgi:nitroreductase